MTTERLAKLADYALSLQDVDEEALQIAEQQAVEICGSTPTETISANDWAVLQPRNEEALEKEEKAFRAKSLVDNCSDMNPL